MSFRGKASSSKSDLRANMSSCKKVPSCIFDSSPKNIYYQYFVEHHITYDKNTQKLGLTTNHKPKFFKILNLLSCFKFLKF